MTTGFLSVNYKEGDSKTYKSLDVRLGDKDYQFDSGDFAKDFNSYIQKLSKEPVDLVNYSSSWDHFWMDGADEDFKEIYLLDNGILTEKPHEDRLRLIVHKNQNFKTLSQYKKVYPKIS